MNESANFTHRTEDFPPGFRQPMSKTTRTPFRVTMLDADCNEIVVGPVWLDIHEPDLSGIESPSHWDHLCAQETEAAKILGQDLQCSLDLDALIGAPAVSDIWRDAIDPANFGKIVCQYPSGSTVNLTMRARAITEELDRLREPADAAISKDETTK